MPSSSECPPTRNKQPTRRISMSSMCLVLVTIAVTIVASHIPTTNANQAADAVAPKRVKRMYALCPPHFERVGSQCYYISDEAVTWLDAHFACKDRNSRLAEPTKPEDHHLRRFLQRNDKSRTTKWIGGMYNWQQNQWQWGYTGRIMDYQSFSQMVPGSSQDLRFHCSVLNSKLKYRWSALPCTDHRRFVCQHRMPYVSDKNRYKVYSKWNQSFPNEMANEVEVVLDELPRGRRRLSPNQVAESNNQIDLTISPKQRAAARRPPNASRTQQAQQRRVRPNIFDKEMANGRFTNDPSRNVDFGAPKRNRTKVRRRQRTSTTTTTTTTTSTTTPVPTESSQIDENSLDINVEEQRRREQENRKRQEQSEWRAKHTQRQEERRRKYRERKRDEEQRRQNQQTQEPEPTTGTPQRPTYTTTVAPQLTQDEILEQKRLAETRRLLGIEKSSGHNFYQQPKTAPTTASRREAEYETATPTTLAPPTTDPDEIILLAEEKRIRAEEERQRQEFEQQQLEDQRAQEEARQQEIHAAEQQERRRKEELQRREQLESRRLIEKQRAQEEASEREQLSQQQEEERIRLEEELRTQEAQRLNQIQLAKAQRKTKEEELRRLKEKSKASMDENETRTNEDTRQMAAQRKEKRDKMKEKLKNMTPEMREEFYRLRNERNRKREANHIPEQ